MNRAIRTPILSPPPASSLPSRTAAALFHSTPAVERRRGNQGSYASSPFRSSKRFNNTKRFRRMEAKQTLLRNVSTYAEYLFQDVVTLNQHSSIFIDGAGDEGRMNREENMQA